MVQITCSRDLTVVVGPGGWQLLQGDFCPVGRQEGQMIQAGVAYPSESVGCTVVRREAKVPTSPRFALQNVCTVVRQEAMKSPCIIPARDVPMDYAPMAP